MQPTGLLETGDLFFAFKEVSYSPKKPKMKEPFSVKGKVDLLKIPFLAPCWIIATVTYPEKWWEEIIPIIGSPEVRETDIALGGDFEVLFPKGFEREGEFQLSVRLYAGPTFPLDSIVLPPAPAVATAETTFVVAGEQPPEEELLRNFRIDSYSKNGGTPISPPNVLQLDVGDRCRVNLSYEHQGPSVVGKFHAAIWQWTALDPHDEILNAEQSFSVPQSADWQSFQSSIDIIITSKISPGSQYGLYCKIMGITGGDVFTPYLADVITIVGAPPSEADIRNFDIQVQGGTYDLGDTVPFTAPYEYKGKAQGGRLTISLGTGVYPSFTTKYTFSSISVNFEESADWVSKTLSGNFKLPTNLEPGQTYSVRAKLETNDGKQETDTDWGVLDIVGGPPTSDIRNFDIQVQGGTYDLGDTVPFTAPYEYKGKAQGGRLTISLGTGVYPSFTTKYTFSSISVNFEESADWVSKTLSGNFKLPTNLEPGQTYSVRAKLETNDGKQETDTDWGVLTITKVEAKRLVINRDPTAGGYVTTSPAPTTGTVYDGYYLKGTTVYVTAHPNAGYTFKSWSGEMTDTANLTAPVYMTENRTITAHFEATQMERLEVNIDPSGGGYVTTSPAPSGGSENYWLFTKGTVVYVTAHPYSGYRFKSWSGEMKDTTAITAPVYEMTEKRTITAHFELVPTTMSFYMRVWGVSTWRPVVDKWMCYYWDPSIGNFVGDEKWYNTYDRIRFANVKAGGYVAVFLLAGGTVSPQFTSPTFTAEDSATYQFDLWLGRVLKYE